MVPPGQENTEGPFHLGNKNKVGQWASWQINMTPHYKPTLISRQVLALITWQYPLNLLSPLIFHHTSHLILMHPKDHLVNSILTNSRLFKTTIKWKIIPRQESIKAKFSRWILKMLWKGAPWHPGTYTDTVFPYSEKTYGNTRKIIIDNKLISI